MVKEFLHAIEEIVRRQKRTLEKTLRGGEKLI
jgi:hypothetical protein